MPGPRSPVVPEIVRDAPHLRVLSHLITFVAGGRTRRKAQDDGPSSSVESSTQHANLIRFIRVGGNAISLDEIDAPTRVKLRNGIVVGLPGSVVLHAVVVDVPRADIVFIGSISGAKIRIGDGQVLRNGFARNTPNDVNTKLEAERMDVVGERLEPRSVCGRRKACGRGYEAAVVAERQAEVRWLCFRIQNVPTLIDHHILPSETLQVLGHRVDRKSTRLNSS